jgi:hypothetical protein
MPMKCYLMKGRSAPVPATTSVLGLPALEEVGPMVCLALVSAEAVLTSSHRRPVFPSRSHSPSPRLPVLSPLPSMMTLAPAAPVVPVDGHQMPIWPSNNGRKQYHK